MKITVISWKDERWSADKESLKNINKMINKDNKQKIRMVHYLNPQTILLYLMYFIGWVYHGTKSFLKWSTNKFRLSLVIIATLSSSCYSPDTVYVREYHRPSPFSTSLFIHHDHHHGHHYNHHSYRRSDRRNSRPTHKVVTPTRNPTPPPSRPISKGVPEPPTNPRDRR